MSSKSVLTLILAIQVVQAAALPYLEVSRIQLGEGITEIVIRDEFALVKAGGRILLLGSDGEREIGLIGDARVMEGSEVFAQSGDKLYSISSSGLEEVAECGGCTFFPHSRGRYAVLTKEGLTLRMDGEERRIGLRPLLVRWSEDGEYLAALFRDGVSLISRNGILWRVNFNTQLFDVAISRGVVIVTSKNCEVYAYTINGSVLWTNRICNCCIPLKLAPSSELVAVALQGKEIVLLDTLSGKVLQRIGVPAYYVQTHGNLVAAIDSEGVVHVLADSSKLKVEGKSSGALLLWELPNWLRGELSYVADGESGSLKVFRISFIPLRGSGNVSLRLRDRNGAEVERRVEVKPLEVKLTPEGTVRVRGEGELSVRAQGRIYNGTEVSVDTGFLPQYTVEVLNYGSVVGEYSCYNSRFTLVAALLASVLIPLLALLVKRR